MAGKLTWAIEFIGLDAALLKLKAIDRTLQSISRHQGTSILGTQNGATAGGRNVVVPSGGGNAAGAAAGAAAGSAAGSAASAAASKPSLPASKFSADAFKKVIVEQGLVSIGSDLKMSLTKLGKAYVKKFQDDLSGQGMQVRSNMAAAGVEGLFYPPKKTKGGAAGSSTGPTPPIIPPPKLKLDWMEKIQEHLGKFGKALSATGIPGVAGLGGMLTKLAGVGSKLGVIGIAVTAVVIALAVAFKFLLQGVEEAARVYQEAAKSGIGVQKTNQLEQALKSMGITEKPTFQMESAMKGGASAGGIIGAARGSGFGGAQQLQNMGKEFASAMRDAAYSSKQMELSAKAGQLLQMDMTAISREWKTMLAEAAANMYPILHGLMEMLKSWLQLFNQYMELLLKMKEWISKKLGIDILPTGGPGQSRWPSGGGGGLPGAGGWEKIGFVFGKGGFSTAMEQTAKNTKDIAGSSNRMVDLLKMVLKTGIMGPVGVAASFAP